MLASLKKLLARTTPSGTTPARPATLAVESLETREVPAVMVMAGWSQSVNTHALAGPAFVDRACAGDAALRGRVEQLLDRHDRVGSFLGRPADTPPAGGIPATVVQLDEPGRAAPGTVVGPYKLLQQIGEGGMGTVFMAE